MVNDSSRAVLRRLRSVCAVVVLAAACAAPVSAASAASNVGIGAGAYDGTFTTFALHLPPAGSRAVVEIDPHARLAELLVNGRVAGRAGRDDSVGALPFGHGASSFSLAGLSARDRIAIRIRGRAARPVALYEVDALATAFGSGLGSGMFLGFLIAVAIVQLLAAFALRDHTLALYVCWIAALVAIEIVRDGMLPLPHARAEAVGILAGTCALIFSVSFSIAYLKLRREAPRLFWLLVGSNVLVAMAPAVVHAMTHAPVRAVAIYLPNAIGIAITVGIALARWRSGFTPASYLAFGLVGLFLVFATQVVRDTLGIESLFWDRWSLEAGASFDFLIFSLGIGYRSRVIAHERRELADKLRIANEEATHDPLTGLLNRRGLDEWMEAAGRPLGTVLFVDIDGFKAVNDEGGHAAGDETLTIVARIIRHSIRSDDAVARIGGDEFAIYLSRCVDPAFVRDCISRISSAVGFLRPLGVTSDTRIGVSIGSAIIYEGRSFALALAEADADAYRVKAEHHAYRRATAAANGAGRR